MTARSAPMCGSHAPVCSVQPGGEWRACFYSGGNTSFLYLRQAGDKKTLRRVRRLLDALPADERAMFRIVEKDELTALGADPAAALAIEPVLGVAVTNNRTGAVVAYLVCTGQVHGNVGPIHATQQLGESQDVPDRRHVSTSSREERGGGRNCTARLPD